MDAYLAAKAALFEPERSRRGVVDLGTPAGARLAARGGIPIRTIATTKGADWRVTVTARSQHGTRFRLEGPSGALESRVGMLGDHAASNAGLAVAMLVEAGIGLDSIAAALGERGLDEPIRGRLERIGDALGPAVHLDVAHTPDAFEKSLTALRSVTRGRVVMVFGADGDRDPTKRFDMGRVAAAGADAVLVTDHHSRFEDPDVIRAALLDGARSAGRAEVLDVPDPVAAIRLAIGMAGRDGAVLWAGTGRTEYRDVRGVKIPFSFHAEALAALDESRRKAA
jgi:UDP-N-acetylmuramoyl-L-alanyl-D-glutamate--2,6-diaminopimelate ligase